MAMVMTRGLIVRVAMEMFLISVLVKVNMGFTHH
jgi:hypothetical protein